MSQSHFLFHLLLWVGATAARAALEPPAHPLFDVDAVHEIRLDFAQPDWWEQLTANFEGYEDPPDIPASFSWNGVLLDSIGVRFKGNSSYWSYYGPKKSFKLDLDAFRDGQELDGLDKLNLNNCFLDPSYLREKCAYEICAAAGLPAGRTNFAALYLNGQYWGLYVLVEQVDQEFIEGRFGAGEEGNLWKGEPHGTLEFQGTDPAAYQDDYELHTNEEENDWSALVDFTAALNNTPTAALRDSLHNRADLNSALAMLAVDNLLVNLDSYLGSGHNYYLYHRDLDSRLVFIPWDLNEAWGVFNMGLGLTQLRQLNPHWMPTGQPRPLAARPWQATALDQAYLGHLRRLMAGPAQPDTLLARMGTLHDLIRPWALADTNTMFSPAQFEASLESNINAPGGPPPGRLIPGLRPFITGRDTWLRQQIGSWSPLRVLVLNEVQADNGGTLADETGDYDDWIELLNSGDTALQLAGLQLTDHWEGEVDFTFPNLLLAPGARVLVWADEEPGEGALHAPFKLDGDGEDLFLVQAGSVLDQTSWTTLPEDAAWGRWPDGSGAWSLLGQPTPGAENRQDPGGDDPALVLNEFLASNSTGIQDESGAREDWLELFNPGPLEAALGGLFLTDDLANPTKWSLPDTLLPAGGFLLVWCDEDEEDGPLHANFKLSAGGEELGLFGRLEAGNLPLDSHMFGAQLADRSEGRLPDGTGVWSALALPSPGDPNLSAVTDLAIHYLSATGEIALEWSAVPGAASYLVLATEDPAAPYPAGWSRVAEGLTQPAWSAAAASETRFFRVLAVTP